MSSSLNGTCPSAAIPATLPIPSNITYVVIPGQNASDPWMVNCCGSYPVQIVETCWEWCQIDPAIASNTFSGDIMSNFSNCLQNNKIKHNVSSIIEVHMAGASRGRGVSLLGSVLAAMVVSTALSVL